MPSIKYAKAPAAYNDIQNDSCRFNETSDCAVIAIALATSTSYSEVHKRLKDKGRRDRSGTYLWQSRKVIEDLGYKIEEFNKRAMIETYPKAHRILKNITTHHPRRFKKAWGLWQQDNLIFVTRRHMLAVIDGQVQDWSINRSLQVQSVWRIVKK